MNVRYHVELRSRAVYYWTPADPGRTGRSASLRDIVATALRGTEISGHRRLRKAARKSGWLRCFSRITSANCIFGRKGGQVTPSAESSVTGMPRLKVVDPSWGRSAVRAQAGFRILFADNPEPKPCQPRSWKYVFGHSAPCIDGWWSARGSWRSLSGYAGRTHPRN